MSRRESKKLLLAKHVAARLMGDVKYPPGTIIQYTSNKNWGVVTTVSPLKNLPYFVTMENGNILNFTADGIANNLSSRSKYKASVRRRRKAGLKVNSLI